MLWSTPTKSSEGDSQIFIGHVVARTTKTGSDRTARTDGREPGRGAGGHSWWGCVKIGEDNRKDLRRSDVLLFEEWSKGERWRDHDIQAIELDCLTHTHFGDCVSEAKI
ncbi:hypothetical protein EVAR_27324_1 [Eumeta japonica]|uniref:Uncharacterized protein n=1 Tax=Eumeta variegata TaxID=151549 RepID=A0A4C1UD94_EUMVA|nr:hypothetical protein EVAR_27324_1 [Eumeta japonica]